MQEYSIDNKAEINSIIEFIFTEKDLITYDHFNENELFKVGQFGIVYFFYLKSDKKDAVLVYVGKTKGIHFKKRMTDHFHHVSAGTNSMLGKVIEAKEQKNQVLLKFIKTFPCSYRNFLEEEIIESVKSEKYADKVKLWNSQKGKTSR